MKNLDDPRGFSYPSAAERIVPPDCVVFPLFLTADAPSESAAIEAARGAAEAAAGALSSVGEAGALRSQKTASRAAKKVASAVFRRMERESHRVSVTMIVRLTLTPTEDFWARTSRLARARDALRELAEKPPSAGVELSIGAAEYHLEDREPHAESLFAAAHARAMKRARVVSEGSPVRTRRVRNADALEVVVLGATEVLLKLEPEIEIELLSA